MTRNIIEFINEHEKDINENKWDEIYSDAADILDSNCGTFTDAIYDAGIDPLAYLNYVPEAYHFNGKRTQIELPEGIIEICADAFGDSHITSITFPDSLATIGTDAFFGSHLTRLELPRNLSSISGWAFGSCKSLEYVLISSSLASISAYCFAACHELKEVEILEGVKSIAKQAFADCRNLKKLFIPDSIISIHRDAFTSHLIIECHKGSYAHRWCVQNDWNFILI